MSSECLNIAAQGFFHQFRPDRKQHEPTCAGLFDCSGPWYFRMCRAGTLSGQRRRMRPARSGPRSGCRRLPGAEFLKARRSRPQGGVNPPYPYAGPWSALGTKQPTARSRHRAAHDRRVGAATAVLGTLWVRSSHRISRRNVAEAPAEGAVGRCPAALRALIPGKGKGF